MCLSLNPRQRVDGNLQFRILKNKLLDLLKKLINQIDVLYLHLRHGHHPTAT